MGDENDRLPVWVKTSAVEAALLPTATKKTKKTFGRRNTLGGVATTNKETTAVVVSSMDQSSKKHEQQPAAKEEETPAPPAVVSTSTTSNSSGPSILKKSSTFLRNSSSLSSSGGMQQSRSEEEEDGTGGSSPAPEKSVAPSINNGNNRNAAATTFSNLDSSLRKSKFMPRQSWEGNNSNGLKGSDKKEGEGTTTPPPPQQAEKIANSTKKVSDGRFFARRATLGHFSSSSTSSGREEESETSPASPASPRKNSALSRKVGTGIRAATSQHSHAFDSALPINVRPLSPTKTHSPIKTRQPLSPTKIHPRRKSLAAPAFAAANAANAAADDDRPLSPTKTRPRRKCLAPIAVSNAADDDRPLSPTKPHPRRKSLAAPAFAAAADDDRPLSPTKTRPRRKSLAPTAVAATAADDDASMQQQVGHIGRNCTWGWRRGWMTRTADGLDIQLVADDAASGSTTAATRTAAAAGTTRADNNVLLRLPADRLNSGDVVLANSYPTDDNGKPVCPHDLITLSHLHEASVVECLRHRYARDFVYTNTGPVLIAVNPFKSLPIYEEETMQSYWEKAEQSLGNSLPPHSFEIADHSFRGMMRGIELELGDAEAAAKRKTSEDGVGEDAAPARRKYDQSILVSGESGAGKTVTTKHVMKYLAALSKRASKYGPKGKKKKTIGSVRAKDPSSAYQQPTSSSSTTGATTPAATISIEAQVLQSNPILESFGNARTVRNDNSSRFGKFIEMQFTASGRLVGAQIETYLLEKVRLMTQGAGERNYHIFFELLSGQLDAAELVLLRLDKSSSPADFKILNGSGTLDRRDGVSDQSTCRSLQRAMTTMGFHSDEQRDVFAVAAAILHASNLTFKDLGHEAQLDKDNPHLGSCCELLGVTSEALNDALCYFSIVARGTEIRRVNSPEKAEKGLEALLKATYAALFAALVKRINESISVKEEEQPPPPQERDDDEDAGPAAADLGNSRPVATIGILDIFGFESFTTNSFEQLCINYCNEGLQQQFNTFLLKNEQEEYEREGIEWRFIEFPDNQDVIDLIEAKKGGIISILDDMCRVPGTTDKSFANDVYKCCGQHPRLKADRKQTATLKFTIEHYAGLVEYTSDGFIEKNRDETPKETAILLRGSSKQLVRSLADIIEDYSNQLTKEAVEDSKSRARPGGGGGGSAGASKNNAAKETVGGHFRAQLKGLRRKIDTTAPHYVRTIKPNDLLVPGRFEAAVVAEQLRCGGILEAIRVTRSGFPAHYDHGDFIKRYWSLMWKEAAKKRASGNVKRPKPNVKEECRELVDTIHTKLKELDQKKHDSNDSDEANTSSWGPGEVLIQFGKTKVFLRYQAFEALERLRGVEQVKAATQLNTIFRRHMARTTYIDMRTCFRRELRQQNTTFEKWFKDNRELYYSRQKGSTDIPKVVQRRTQWLKEDVLGSGKLRSSVAGLENSKRKAAAQKSDWIVKGGVWMRRSSVDSKDDEEGKTLAKEAIPETEENSGTKVAKKQIPLDKEEVNVLATASTPTLDVEAKGPPAKANESQPEDQEQDATDKSFGLAGPSSTTPKPVDEAKKDLSIPNEKGDATNYPYSPSEGNDVLDEVTSSPKASPILFKSASQEVEETVAHTNAKRQRDDDHTNKLGSPSGIPIDTAVSPATSLYEKEPSLRSSNPGSLVEERETDSPEKISDSSRAPSSLLEKECKPSLGKYEPQNTSDKAANSIKNSSVQQSTVTSGFVGSKLATGGEETTALIEKHISSPEKEAIADKPNESTDSSSFLCDQTDTEAIALIGDSEIVVCSNQPTDAAAADKLDATTQENSPSTGTPNGSTEQNEITDTAEKLGVDTPVKSNKEVCTPTEKASEGDAPTGPYFSQEKPPINDSVETSLSLLCIPNRDATNNETPVPASNVNNEVVAGEDKRENPVSLETSPMKPQSPETPADKPAHKSSILRKAKYQPACSGDDAKGSVTGKDSVKGLVQEAEGSQKAAKDPNSPAQRGSSILRKAKYHKGKQLGAWEGKLIGQDNTKNTEQLVPVTPIQRLKKSSVGKLTIPKSSASAPAPQHVSSPIKAVPEYVGSLDESIDVSPLHSPKCQSRRLGVVPPPPSLARPTPDEANERGRKAVRSSENGKSTNPKRCKSVPRKISDIDQTPEKTLNLKEGKLRVESGEAPATQETAKTLLQTRTIVSETGTKHAKSFSKSSLSKSSLSPLTPDNWKKLQRSKSVPRKKQHDMESAEEPAAGEQTATNMAASGVKRAVKLSSQRSKSVGRPRGRSLRRDDEEEGVRLRPTHGEHESPTKKVKKKVKKYVKATDLSSLEIIA